MTDVNMEKMNPIKIWRCMLLGHKAGKDMLEVMFPESPLNQKEWVTGWCEYCGVPIYIRRDISSTKHYYIGERYDF